MKVDSPPTSASPSSTPTPSSKSHQSSPPPAIARGRDEVREVFNQFDETWESHRSDVEEIQLIDPDRVLLLSVDHFRGRDGIEIEQPSATIFTLRNGKVVRMQSFWERASALKAVGR